MVLVNGTVPYPEVGMSTTQVAKLDQDLAIYQAFCRGARKVDLAQQYNVDRHTITDAIERAIAAMPEVDRGQLLDQSLAILDAGLAVYVPMMLDGDKAAGRLVDRFLGRRGAYLGLETPQKLELFQAQAQVRDQVNVRAELAGLVERILERQGMSHG
jgi:hypothetical protein